MSEHTPGPWKIDQEWRYDHHPKWRNIVSEFDDKNERLQVNGHMGEANARLICAAPELLEALKAVIDWLDDGSILLSEVCAANVLQARAAIAKAEGKQ